MDKKLQNIVEQTQKNLSALSRFYGNSIYIDRTGKTQGAVSGNVTDLEADIGSDEIRKPLVEVDLFGNVVAMKEEWEFSQSINELDSLICECQKCVLGATRTKFVFGVGNPKADIVMVGEAPGADEDAKGEPFVGRAGQLLNKILNAIELKREEVYICNILKCRPPGNRNPMPEEINSCEPYLKKQLDLIKPKLILILGKVAADTLLNLKQPLNKMRGKIHYYNGVKTMVTFHPAALLRNPNWKPPAWEDMKQFKKIYEELKEK